MKHPSVPFQPRYCQYILSGRLIEAWGQGIFIMIDDCAGANVPPPLFKYDLSGFVIEFKKPTEETREKIIQLIGSNEDITTGEIAIATGITKKGVEYHLTKLKQEKIIERKGPDKGGKWFLADR
jgi:ATP-dependent DNA helicase RecG